MKRLRWSPGELLGIAFPLLVVQVLLYLSATGTPDLITDPMLAVALGLACTALAGAVFGNWGLLLTAIAATAIALSADSSRSFQERGLALAFQVPALAAWIALAGTIGRHLLTGWQRGRQLRLGKHLAAQRERIRELEQLASAGGVAEAIGASVAAWQQRVEDLVQHATELLVHTRDDDEAQAAMKRFEASLTDLRHALESQQSIAQGMHYNPQHEASLAEVVTKAAELAAPTLNECGVELEFDTEAAGVPCQMDLDLAARAVAELIRNAAEASYRGAKITVAASSDYRGSRGVIEVMDRGSGMHLDMVRHVFKPFFSTRKGHMGLGLSIAREVARRMGGSITVAANEMRGMTFKLRIPMRRAGLADTAVVLVDDEDPASEPAIEQESEAETVAAPGAQASKRRQNTTPDKLPDLAGIDLNNPEVMRILAEELAKQAQSRRGKVMPETSA